MTKKNVIIIVLIVVIFLIVFALTHILLLTNWLNKDLNKFNYDTAKETAIKYLNNNPKQLQDLIDELYESKGSIKGPNGNIKYAAYIYSADLNFQNKQEYIQLDLDAQGMLGGQYYGLIYSQNDDEELIIYDEHKETGKGNNIFIRQKIKDNWYFYYNDFDGKVDIGKIK